MRFRFSLIAALTILLAASGANADRQYTKWGMSQKDVLATSKGQVSPITDQRLADYKMTGDFRGGRVLLSGDYSAGNFVFHAFFGFNGSGKLKYVLLRLKDYSACGDLRESVFSKYGRPNYVGNGTKSQYVVANEWIDKPNSNLIELMDSDLIGSCQILYSGIDAKSSSGL